MNISLKKIMTMVTLGAMLCISAENVEVTAKGIPGKTLVSVSESWLDNVLQEQPDLVVMLYGTNDACNSRVLSTPEEYEARLKAVVRTICNRSKLIVVTIPPCNETCLFKRHKASAYGTMPPNERIRKFNAIIERIAKENKIPLADFYSVVAKHGCEGKQSYLRLPENSGDADGIHLTDEGYAVLAETVYEALRKAGIQPKKVLCIGDSITYGIGTKTAGTVSGNTYPAILKRILENTENTDK